MRYFIIGFIGFVVGMCFTFITIEIDRVETERKAAQKKYEKELLDLRIKSFVSRAKLHADQYLFKIVKLQQQKLEDQQKQIDSLKKR